MMMMTTTSLSFFFSEISTEIAIDFGKSQPRPIACPYVISRAESRSNARGTIDLSRGLPSLKGKERCRLPAFARGSLLVAQQ